MDTQIIKPIAVGDLHITRFTIEHFPGDALGIPTATPRMNWTYSRTVPDGSQILLKISRRIPGAQAREEYTYLPPEDNVLVPWQFTPLASREEVFATVQLVSAAHKPLSDPSATLHFEAGLMQEYEHVADFVGPSWAEPETDHRHLPLVRTEIAIKAKPKRARLYLSALGLVEAEINGVKIGNDALIPGWTNYEQRVQCWTYDVTDELNEGANAMGFWLGDGWYRGRLGFDGGYVNYYGDRLGVFAQLEIEYEDGGIEHVYSNAWDRQWKASLGPIVCSDLCEGERYDARLEQPGWSEPGFDDSNWKPVSEISMIPRKSRIPIPHRCARMKSTNRYPSRAPATLLTAVASGWSTSARTARSAFVYASQALRPGRAWNCIMWRYSNRTVRSPHAPCAAASSMTSTRPTARTPGGSRVSRCMTSVMRRSRAWWAS